MSYYIVQADIEARVSARVLRQVYDDDRAGVAQAAAIAQLIEDAESFVEEIVSGTYDIVEVRAASPVLSAMKRLCLDVAVSYLRERWPSHTKALAAKSWERLKSECKEVELSCRRINPAGETSGPANVGGTVDPGVPDGYPYPRIWDFSGTGWF